MLINLLYVMWILKEIELVSVCFWLEFDECSGWQITLVINDGGKKMLLVNIANGIP